MARTPANAPSRLQLALHGVASRALRAALAARRPSSEAPAVAFLIMHAWGMGGTIRSTLTVAGHLGQTQRVEVLSVVRRAGRPFFAFPRSARVVGVDDQRRGVRHGVRGIASRLLGRWPSVLLHPADRAAANAASLWTDVVLVRQLWRVRGAVLVGTRPALNMLAADAGTVAVGVEHMHLAAHPEPLRRAILGTYPDLAAIVTLTERDRAEYAAALPALRSVTIPNAVAAIRGPSDHRSPVLLAAGRMTRQKGFDRLIPAFAPIAREHPEWRLEIRGDGPMRRRLRRLVRREGLTGRVRLRHATATLDRDMRRASAYVLSSRFEGLPMVLLEAMANGLPVVAFDCPTGPREILDDERDGLLVSDGDVAALTAAMRRVVEDPLLRARLALAAEAKAERYRLDAIGPRWAELLAELGR